MIEIKRVYLPAAKEDGFRILIDRLWPRGLTKEEAGVDLWLKDIAPSTGLRKWFGHEPNKWEEFRRRYFTELEGKKGLIESLIRKSREGKVTLVFGAKEERFNDAVALKEYLERRVH